ncbi:peptidoglycan hydrolase-like protein with peptidoglycan-binding domain [Actinokineospora baliensis]|uniref:peptidoglycan-binding protein n=1 Tax=Actinokineospora baliensis TaxID=547056 RepID=UPI00195D91C1|nr:peptidoglycan-binding protein [Actinokineospora baliensis]MBM7771986.1 peptidoglycan hydrolase-like protein with peptidoglycan-binding domain [Actinokineospora baliensis]
MPVSQNGWPVDPPRSSRLVPGTNVRVTVANGPAGDVLLHVLSQFDRRVEDLDLASTRGELDDWGYASRPIRGGTATSNHSSATAVDANATRHPLGVRGTFNAAQVAEIHRILNEVEHVVRWGGDYVGRPDEMHFEINASYEHVARVAARLAGGSSPSPSPAPNGRPTLRRGSNGADVALVQRYLGVRPADGIFGPATEAAVRTYQARQLLSVDGVVGPSTWARIQSGLGSAVPAGGGTPAPAPPRPSRPTIRRGSTGEDVETLQRWLGLPTDGAFGPATEAKVRRYQAMKGLSADGVVGPKTWAAMGL